MGDDAVAESPGMGDQAAHDLPAAGPGHRHRRFTGSGDVEASTRTRSCVASTTQPTWASIFQEDTSTDEHDGGVVGQVERGEQVHRHLGRGVPTGQVQNLTAEIQTEAGGGEQILLELHGVRDTFGFIGQGGELRPSVGQRGLLM